MSTKRQPSKQRRQTQNQRQRAALEARRANAAAAGAVPDGKVGGGGVGRHELGRRRWLAVLPPPRGASATGRAIRTGTPADGQPVGYRAALSGLLAGGRGRGGRRAR